MIVSVLTRLARWLDVDALQLRTLLRLALRLDLRAGGTTLGGRTQSRGWDRAARLLLAYALVGTVVAWLIQPLPDVFTSALVYLSSVAFLLGALVVLEFNSLMVSPEDYRQLAHLPLTSRTLFFSRLLHVLVYTSALCLAFSLAPLTVFLLDFGGLRPLLALGAGVAALGASATSVLGGLALYAALLRFVPPARLRALLSYVQLALSLSVYGGFLFMRRRRDLADLSVLSLDGEPVLLLYPMSWFASWADVAGGHIAVLALGASALGGLALVSLLWFAARVLSSRYAERLTDLELTESMPLPVRARRAPSLSRRGEGRVLALLVPSQFRHDMRFRLGVLGVIPLTFLYLFLGLEEAPLPDPFLRQPFTQGMGLLYMAVLITPALLVPSFVYSDAFAGAWIFHATPADRPRLVLGMRNCIWLYFIVPSIVLLTATFVFFFESPWQAVLHAVLLGAFAGLFLTLAMLASPGLPFATPVQRGRFALRSFVPYMIAPLFAFGLLPWVFSVSYTSTTYVLVLTATLLALNLGLGRWVARRIARREGSLAYLA